MDKHLELSDSNFEQAINIRQPVLIDFWREGCVPCKMLEPVIEGLYLKHKGKFRMFKANINKCSRTAAKYRIMSVPTVMLFIKGRPVERLTGFVKESVLGPKIAAHI